MVVIVTVIVVLVMTLLSKMLKTMTLPALRDPGSSDRESDALLYAFVILLVATSAYSSPV